MKKSIYFIFIVLSLFSCSDSKVIVQYVLKNATDENIVVERVETDIKKIVYTISPNTSELIYSTYLIDESYENEEFNSLLSNINVSTNIDNITYSIEKDSISVLSKWIKSVSYDMGDQYILYTKVIEPDMFNN